MAHRFADNVSSDPLGKTMSSDIKCRRRGKLGGSTKTPYLRGLYCIWRVGLGVNFFTFFSEQDTLTNLVQSPLIHYWTL